MLYLLVSLLVAVALPVLLIHFLYSSAKVLALMAPNALISCPLVALGLVFNQRPCRAYMCCSLWWVSHVLRPLDLSHPVPVVPLVSATLYQRLRELGAHCLVLHFSLSSCFCVQEHTQY